ncbi:TPA: hypothetical protein EYP66_15550 [Candidatus Poribacteria bacterium]|nr:hypothetical protein [Candidatus Poribacteria bacterium]
MPEVWRMKMRFILCILCINLIGCLPIQKEQEFPRIPLVTISSANITYNSNHKTIRLIKVGGAFPTWSSDNKKIFFVLGSDIFTVNINKANLNRLTKGLLCDGSLLGGLSVAPDDKRIAFVKMVTQRGRDMRDIYILNLENWNVQRLTKSEGNNNFPSWFVDGKKIAFTSDRDGYARIYMMNETGEIFGRLTKGVADSMKTAFSKDGTKLAFVSFRDGNAEIYIMDSDGSNQRNLTNSPAMDIDPSWSPDSKKIVFASDRSGNFNLYVMDIDGSNVERLTESTEDEMNPAWSPSGHEIAFSSVHLSTGQIR